MMMMSKFTSVALLLIVALVTIVGTLADAQASTQYSFKLGNNNLLLARNSTSQPWGTMCDDSFTWQTAYAICGMMGYTNRAQVFWTITSGDAALPIGLDNVVCPMNATDFTGQCSYNAYHNCYHTEDVALFCTGRPLQYRVASHILQFSPDATKWESVSAVGFTNATARAICKLRGYSDDASMYFRAVSGWANYHNVSCPVLGTRYLADCTYTHWPVYTAGTASVVELFCGTARYPWEFSLSVPGSSNNLLLARVKNTATWTTVCDDYFDANAARAICATMGVANAVPSFWTNLTRRSSMYAIGLDDVVCPSTAVDFRNCSYNEAPQCSAHEDIFMSCTAVQREDYNFTIGAGNILYAQKKGATSNAWGTVCDDSFSTATARKICNFMGFADTSKAFWWKSDNHADGPIALSNVKCPAGSTSFTNCSYKSAGQFSCSHYEDIALTCDGSGMTFDAFVDRNNYNALQLNLRGTKAYYYVGGTQFTNASAANLCTALGYTDVTKFMTMNLPWTPSGGVVVDNVSCPTGATSFNDCAYTFTDAGNAAVRPIALSCGTARKPWTWQVTNNSLLLAKSPAGNAPWGTVCDDHFSMAAAQMICKRLGFGDGKSAQWTKGAGGGSSYPIVAESVKCPADATGMSQCTYHERTDCSHYEDVALNCNASIPHFNFRIQPSTNIVEAQLLGSSSWGSVCDDYFSAASAATICRTMGFTDVSKMYWWTRADSTYNGSVLLSNVECPADATDLTLCTYKLNPTSCSHSEDIALTCDGTGVKFTTQVQGQSTKISVAGTGRWGFLGKNVQQSAVNTMCESLGYTNASAFKLVVVPASQYNILIDNVSCPVTASDLSQCTFNFAPKNSWVLSDVGNLNCGTARLPWKFKLLPYSTSWAQMNALYAQAPGSNAWGAVGSDYFNDNSAFAICKFMGYPMLTTTASWQATGVRTMPGYSNLLNFVECAKNATQFSTCSFTVYPSFVSSTVALNCTVPMATTMPPSPSSTAAPATGGYNFSVSTQPGAAAVLWAVDAATGKSLGTVCSDWFSINSAKAICRQMGYTDLSRVLWKKADANFVAPGTPIALDNIECPAGAQSLADCTYSAQPGCEHSEDVLLYCDTVAMNVDVGMKIGYYNSQTILEVDPGMRNMYGAVANSASINQNAITCACMKMGFIGGNYTWSVIKGYEYNVAMTNVSCNPTCEGCTYALNYAIQPFDIVGINCGTQKATYAFKLGTNGLLLAKKPAPAGASYGTVCAGPTGLSSETAQFFCKQLNFSGDAAKTQYWVGDASAAGYSAAIGDVSCPAAGSSFSSACMWEATPMCNSTGSVYLNCNAQPPVAGIPDLRIAGDGQLQGFNKTTSTWSTVCNDYFDEPTAKGICGLLGFSSASAQFSKGGAIGGAAIVGALSVSDIQCPATATSVSDCSYNSGTNACLTDRPVYLSCNKIESDFTFTLGSNGLVLANRSIDNKVGTVCNDGFSDASAKAICTLLGQGTANTKWWTQATQSTQYPVVVESVACPLVPITNFRTQCNYSLQNDCTNQEAVAISCSGNLPVAFTLGATTVAGTNNKVLWANAAGSTVPRPVGSTGFDTTTAQRVCSFMGYTSSASATFSTTTLSTQAVFFTSLTCTAAATSLNNGAGCTYTLGREMPAPQTMTVVTLNCGTARAAYKVKQAASGLVQVQAPGTTTWGTMCSDAVTVPTVQGLCGALGYPNAQNVGFWTIGGGTGSILIDELSCPAVGTTNLTQCTFDTTTNCVHDEDLAVACDTTAPGLFQLSIDATTHTVKVQTPGTASAWGTVCGDSIDVNTASGLCGITGMPQAVPAFTSSAVTDVSTIALRSLKCPAGARSIFDCQFSQTGHCASSLTLYCNTAPTTGATTVQPSTLMPTGAPGAIQLRLDASRNSQLQAYNASTMAWNTVCSDYFDQATATALCGIMGYSRTSAAFTVGTVGVNTIGKLYAADVQCPAAATNIYDCLWTDGQVGCANEAPVYLTCNKVPVDFKFALGANGLLMATRGSDNVTGTVCNDGFSNNAANAICGLMGTATTKARWWTQATLQPYPVVAESVSCPASGVTSFMHDCNYSIYNDCSNNEAVGISCDGTIDVAFSIRAADNTLWARATGSSTSRPVAAAGFDQATATAVCRFMGYTPAKASDISMGTASLKTLAVFFSSLTCASTAANINTCNFALGREMSAPKNLTVATLNCGGTRAPYSVKQLASGLIQVQAPGATSWGTMCDDGMTTTTLTGLCSILGYNSTAANTVAYWPLNGAAVSGSVLVDAVQCPAAAAKLGDCNYSTSTQCTHDEDLAIACDTTAPGLFKFGLCGADCGGANIVKVQTPGTSTLWGNVCGDSIDLATATGICSMMGVTGGAVSYSSVVTADPKKIALRSLKCPSWAKSIFDCQFAMAGQCASSLTLWCVAKPTTTSTTAAPSVKALQLRIQPGGKTLQGRMSSGDAWAAVCSDYFGAKSAAGVCGMLGFSRASAAAYLGGMAPASTLAVADLTCPMDAASPASCTYNAQVGCAAESTIQLTCTKVESDFTFALGNNGLVLATRAKDNVTGTVCNDGFSAASAKAICGLMGKGTANAIWWTQATQATLPIVVESVSCPLRPITSFKTECNYSLQNDCSNHEAVAISCSGQIGVDFTLAADGTLMAAATGSIVPRPVSATGFDTTTAQRVCSFMGYTSTASASFKTKSVATHALFFTNLTCPASASSVNGCTYTLGREITGAAVTKTVVTLNCGTARAAYAIARSPSMLVKVSAPGAWSTGTMCSDLMTPTTARGLCNVLGYKNTTNVGWWRQKGTGSILLDNVVCPANAPNMSACQFTTTADCTHNEDLALACDTTQKIFSFQLNKGDNNMRVRGPGSLSWGYVCGDSINLQTAAAMCKFAGQQPYNPAFFPVTNNAAATANTVMRSIVCPSTARSIFDCQFSQTGACTSVLSVVCNMATPPPATPTPPTPPPSVSVRAKKGANFDMNTAVAQIVRMLNGTVAAKDVVVKELANNASVVITVTGPNAQKAANMMEHLDKSQEQSLGLTGFATITSDAPSEPAKKKMNIAAVAGGIAAGVVVLALLAYFGLKKKGASDDHKQFDQSNVKYSNFNDKELQGDADAAV